MSDSADDLAEFTPAPPARPERPASRGTSEKRHGTALAVLMLVFLGGGFLAFLAAITSSYIMLAMIAIPLGFGAMGALHYFTWGFWLQRAYREQEKNENFWDVTQPPVSDLNPRIK